MMRRCGSHKYRTAAAILAFALAGWPEALFAQANVEAMQGVQFDFLAPGARSLAMGGAFVAVADDATAALSNPAGLSKLTRREVSFELRTRQFKVPFAFSGRLFGDPTNVGIDTVATPTFQEASTSETNLGFLSIVFASPERRWAAAAYRHATVSFSTNLRTAGAFNFQEDDDFRFFPATGELVLDIVNYGFAGSYKMWRSCSDVAGARVCEDRLALGGGLSIYRFNIDSVTTRFGPFLSGTGTGGFFGPPAYNTVTNTQTLEGDETGFGVNFGVIAKPTNRLQLGLSHRRGSTFDFSARHEGPSFTGYTREGTFAMPHVTTAGAAFKLGAASLLAVDYSRVKYSRLTDRFVDVFFNPALELPEDDTAGDFSADDGNEIHLGFEHQLLNMRWTPALRLGTWYDPSHSVTASVQRGIGPLFRAGSDEWHFTVGGGLVISRAEVSFGGDFSDRGNIGSASLVWRF